MEHLPTTSEATEPSPSTNEIERKPDSFVHLAGVGFIKRDFTDFTNEELGAFTSNVQVIEQVGSRPWCLLTPIATKDWRSTLAELDHKVYMIHQLTLDFAQLKDELPLSDVRSYIQQHFDRPYDDYSLMQMSDSQLSVVMNNGHLTVKAAERLIELAEQIQIEFKKASQDDTGY